MNRLPFVLAALLACNVSAKTVTIAATPPMGWNSWNHFREKVSARDIRAAADAMVASGMRDAGYVYINIDDGWQGERDVHGVLHPNAKFPDMKALADYVHARGLKLGIYSSPGPTTCAGYPGSYGHEAQDARTFAAWGVDFLKYDLCSFEQRPMAARYPHDVQAQMRLMREAYARMRAALDAVARPIVYSLCQYGLDDSWTWGPGDAVKANLWRTSGDIRLDWQSVLANASQDAGLAAFAGPGHWNDPDMLEVGNAVDGRELTLAEDRSHFSLWAMLAAPLIAGNDLSTMSPEVRAVLTNKAVIAIDQDTSGHQGTRAYSADEYDVWTRPLSDGGLAIAVVNLGPTRHGAARAFHLDPARLGLAGPRHGTELWTGKSLTLDAHTPILLGEHDVWMVRLDP